MKYRVEFSDQARADLSNIFAWIAADSPEYAVRWVATLEAASQSLEVSPERCPVAPEDIEFEDVEIRHLVVRRFRVLFTVTGQTVIVLHVRHGSRRTAARDELAGDLRPDW